MTTNHIPFWRVPRRIAYVVSHSYPHSTNGYAVRTHGIACALVKHGHSVIVITRPGRPWDLVAEGQIDAIDHQVIDGVLYRYVRFPSSRSKEPVNWRKEAALSLEDEFNLFKPSIVLAASNWETAMPAMEAAQHLNLPFYYEVRGFWEITRSSKEPTWANSAAFKESVESEIKVAQAAHRVFTLNSKMSTELINRGISASAIDLVPNGWSSSFEQPKSGNNNSLNQKKTSQYVVGYVGSFVGYEGLDDLVTACAGLRKAGVDLSLWLVGSSNSTGDATTLNRPCKFSQELVHLAESLEFRPFLQLFGRIDPESLGSYYESIDLIVIPRKSLPVTELVSPIKPLEAAAYGKAMLVSDVGGLSDVVQELDLPVFRNGDPNDLAHQINLLLFDVAKRDALGNAARQWIKTNRSFSKMVTPMLVTFKTIEAIDHLILLEQRTRHQQDSDETDQGHNHILGIVKQGGVDALRYYIKRQSISKKPDMQEAIRYLRTAHQLLEINELSSVLFLTKAALEIDTSLSALRLALRIFLDSAEFIKAETVAKQFKAKSKKLSSTEQKLLNEIAGGAQLAAWGAKPTVPRKLPITNRCVLNILAFSLPYTSVGYAIRSHGLAIGIKNSGWDIRPYTRPGFPFDHKPELEGQILPDDDEIDGIFYRRIFDIGRKGMSEVEYMLASISIYEQIIQAEQPEIVHAASNYVTALPAMIAARRLGVPFVYEVRGFWETTRASRDENFINTRKYRFMQLYEGITARHADHVITITSAMKEELMARGIPEDHISIAYNSVDPNRFMPRQANKELAARLGLADGVPVIGYVGSFVDYEGLDDLITACAGLVMEGLQFQLLMVGDGAMAEMLHQLVSATPGLVGIVKFVGRVPHEQTEDYYSLIDITPFPRKPWDVCEQVSPLKPFEAMALEKAVVVSNTRALSEIVTHEVNGLTFEKGNNADLQKVLSRLLRDNTLRKMLGKAGRQWVLKQRTWNKAGEVCAESYSMTLRKVCTTAAGMTADA